MTVKKTESCNWNIRQSTIPGITEEQYYKLQSGDEVELDPETSDYLLEHGYAEEKK